MVTAAVIDVKVRIINHKSSESYGDDGGDGGLGRGEGGIRTRTSGGYDCFVIAEVVCVNEGGKGERDGRAVVRGLGRGREGGKFVMGDEL